MKLTAPLVLAACLFAGSAALAAQITWDDELCTNTVRFDSKKVDATALRNTALLLFATVPPIGGMPTNTPSLFSPDAAAKADLPALERECAELQRSGANLKVLPIAGIEDLRAMLLDEARDSCAFYGALTRSLKDPAALRDYTPALPACAVYVDALEGKTDFEKTWRDATEIACKDNASPASCKARIVAEGTQPDGALRKRLFLANFGWNNCAVPFMKLNADGDRRDRMREALQKKFKAQFRIVRSKCERP